MSDDKSPGNVFYLHRAEDRPANQGDRKYPLKNRRYAPNVCQHYEQVIDERARTVECGKCGVLLDPIDVIQGYALDPEWIDHARKERKELEQTIVDLKDQIAKLRATKRRLERD